MYNETAKLKWIEEKESQVILPQGALKRAFDKIELYENKLDKELCDFNLAEVVNFFQTLNSNTPETLNVINSYYKQYTDYCITHNIAESDFNAYDNLSLSDFYSIVNNYAKEQKIMTRKEILEYCKKLPNYVDKFVLLGLFEGINGSFFSDFIDVSISDVNEKKKTIKLSNRIIPVSSELINIAIEAYNEERYTGVDGNAKIAKPYIKSDLIIKHFSQTRVSNSEHRSGRRVQTKMFNILNELNISKWINSNDIINSGKIDWILNNCPKENIRGIFYKEKNTDEEMKQRFKYQFDIDVLRTNWYIKYERYFK